MHAFDAASGAVAWQADYVISFAATTVAGGMTFNGPANGTAIAVRDAATGMLVDAVAVPDPPGRAWPLSATRS